MMHPTLYLPVAIFITLSHHVSSLTSSLYPTHGQRKGGTLITVVGKLPVSTRIYIADGESRLPVDFIRESIKNGYFNMLPKEGHDDHVSIIVKTGNTANEQVLYNYTYLPDPRVTHISRNESIFSGGLPIVFTVENINSAYVYRQVYYLDEVNTKDVNCTVTNSSVECISPSYTSLFSRGKRELKFPNREILSTLMADNKNVNGAENLTIVVYESDPKLYPFNKIQSITIVGGDAHSASVEVSGEYLNVGVSKEDYDIRLIEESGQVFGCNVSKLERNSLSCEPDINIESEVRFNLTMKVKIGGLQYNVGQVDYFAVASITELVLGLSIGLPLLIFIILIIVIVRLCKKVKSSSTRETEQESLVDLRISDDLKELLKGMIISPSHLNDNTRYAGKGNFGYVYVGQLYIASTRCLRTVAVKSLKDSIDVNGSLIESFLREACLLKGYSHVNVLSTIGVVWKVRDRPQVILPYMALGDLRSLIASEEKHFTLGDLLHFGMQVACGMEYLSENKFVHRDLAARNCLVNDKFIVKIADFGLSRDVYESSYYRENDRSKPRPVKWMALESIKEGIFNSTTDVWSFGIVLWELLTRGNVPYPSIRNQDIYNYLSNGNRMDSPQYAPPVIYNIMTQCWLAKPRMRPTFQQLLKLLADILQSQEGSTTGGTNYDYYNRESTKDLPDNYVVMIEDDQLEPEYVDVGDLNLYWKDSDTN